LAAASLYMLKLIIFFRPYARYMLIAWLLTIIIVSSSPSIPVMKLHAGDKEIRLDYLLHFLEYGILSFMTYLTFSGNNFLISLRKYAVLTGLLILFALFDEFHQIIIPGRSYNIYDIYSNLSGIAAALVFCVVVFRIIARNKT
jgi:VanZ family protein